MKAIHNGIAIEGTPQEIVEYQRLSQEQETLKFDNPYFAPYPYQTPDWCKITSGGTGGRHTLRLSQNSQVSQ